MEITRRDLFKSSVASSWLRPQVAWSRLRTIRRIVVVKKQLWITGDRQMLEHTKAGSGDRLAMILLHDDAEREYAYGPTRGLPDTKVDRQHEKRLEACSQLISRACLCGTPLLMFILLACAHVFAQQSLSTTAQDPAPSANDTETLQKATQNPVANLISVPLQNNTNLGIGPFDRNQNVLNVQPVIPVHVSENWNLIIRWITPIIFQPAPGTANLEVYGIEENTPAYLGAQDVQKSAGVFGLGDMTPTFFLSPAKAHKLIWGAGPVFILPSATSKVLGQGKLSMGPSFVALVQPGHWTIGALINNVWSVAGPSDRKAVNQMTLQYFINYNLKKGWYLAMQPIITANWKAASGNIWTVPVGGGVGRIMKLGFQPVNLTAQFYGNAAYPLHGSPWGMRLQIAFLFPKLNKEEEKALLEKRLKELEQPPQKQ
jgi:hypothetical protein